MNPIDRVVFFHENSVGLRTNESTYVQYKSFVRRCYLPGRDGAKSRTKNDRYVGNAHVIEEKHSSIVDYHTVVYLL